MNQGNIHNLEEALDILAELGMPKGQINERSAYCLLALLNLTPEKSWTQAESPLMGITPIMNFCREHYGKVYAPNTRETFRRSTMHQFVEAGIALHNPDNPARPVNSPKSVYQIEPTTLELLRKFGTPEWESSLQTYLKKRTTLAKRYAKEREQRMIPLQIAQDKKIHISPGEHSQLIKAIVEEFGPRFVPGGTLIYVGDTGEKFGYFDDQTLLDLGVTVDSHGKMPDVIIYCSERNWLLLIEAVTSHGPVNAKRHNELRKLFKDSTAGIVYVTAFPNRSVTAQYLSDIAWETEVWVADSPSHLIHFDGERFLGPY
jgi:hypothetical protein